MLKWLVYAIGVAYCAIFYWSARAVFVLNDVGIYDEGGPLEMLQAVVLAICTVLFLVASFRTREQGRLILLFCALLCYGFVVRELEVRLMDVPLLVKTLCSGRGRNISLVIGFSALLIGACARFSYYKRAGIAFVKSRAGTLLMVGGALLWVGDLFEKMHSIPHHAYFEEISELCGYVFILLSALAANAAITCRNR
jgi:hypothetical protein